jgi:hypothetical protein
MAHFAKIQNDIVEQVIAISNDAIDGGDFPQSESLGQALLAQSGFEGQYLQCSYSASFRGAYPAQGFIWDGSEFLAPIEVQPQWPPTPETE